MHNPRASRTKPHTLFGIARHQPREGASCLEFCFVARAKKGRSLLVLVYDRPCGWGSLGASSELCLLFSSLMNDTWDNLTGSKWDPQQMSIRQRWIIWLHETNRAFYSAVRLLSLMLGIYMGSAPNKSSSPFARSQVLSSIEIWPMRLLYDIFQVALSRQAFIKERRIQMHEGLYYHLLTRFYHDYTMIKNPQRTNAWACKY